MTTAPQSTLHRALPAGLAGLLASAIWAIGVSQPPAGPALAQADRTAAVEGVVTDRLTASPIPGASVSAPALGLNATSDASGRFRWSAIPLTDASIPVTLTIRADGYGDWTIQDVLLVRGDTLQLDAQLGPEPTTILVPAPPDQRPEPPPLVEALALGGAAPLDQTSLPLPATIRVRVTGYPYCDTSRPYTIQTVDFMEYVKHVLPNEWLPSWPWESLRAGAMAAKMYAWSIIAAGGRYPDADVYDSTCDQVYNPSVSYASTDVSVEYTWNWRQTRSGNLVRTYYRAYYSQCVDAGLAGSCMGQYDSRDLAIDGYTWDEILTYFYPGSVFTPVWLPPGGYSLRFYGNGYGDLDRVKILIDAPARPADVGATDFTLEWWMKAFAAD
ncbi:MAG: carboxypeptidase regulatory-like domain-containing protein, partial [Chloroflexota bacterium]